MASPGLDLRQRRLARVGLALMLLGMWSCASARGPAQIDRQYASPDAAYAASVVIPPGYATVRLAGVIPDPVERSTTIYGDTETQTASVLSKIAVRLRDMGLSERDVVAMTVYLVAPPPGDTMDYAGMMRAYSRAYGSAAQPLRPVRSTVQVAGLPAGAWVEIEVTAIRPLP